MASDDADAASEPDRDPGDFRVWFPLHPETVIEAAERLEETGEPYSAYLAAELSDGYHRADADLSGYRDPPMEGFDE